MSPDRWLRCTSAWARPQVLCANTKSEAGGALGIDSRATRPLPVVAAPLSRHSAELAVRRPTSAELRILRSFEDARGRIAALYTRIVLLWLVAVTAGFFLTYVLARRIVEPVTQLDRAASA